MNFKKILIPSPVEITDRNKSTKIGEYSYGDFVLTTNGCGELFAEAANYLKSRLFRETASKGCEGKYEICLEITGSEAELASKSEAYIIDITENSAHLIASDEAGAYYAAVTFAKLIHRKGNSILLPCCRILDYPRYKTRGHFMECRYGSDFMTQKDWENAIDYLSEMKINKVVCGLYGCWGRQYDGEFAEYLYIPFKKYPDLKTPRHIKYYSAKKRSMIYKKDILPTMFADDYYGELTKYGKKRNIELIPLFNSLGHNTLLPRVFPEISAIDENGNFSSLGFCTNNDKTYEILFGIYDEIIDKYLAPNGIDSFEIGLDEVWKLIGLNPANLQEERSPFCQCDKCRGKEYAGLMVDYIIKITKHLKEKGINNVYVYHDMLFKGGFLTEETAQRFKDEGIYDNIVIDWWSYNIDPAKNFSGRPDDVNGLFRSVGKPITGYFHWNMPTQGNNNIYIINQISHKHNFEGMIAYSSFEYCYDFNYQVFAECAWRGTDAADVHELLERYAYTNFGDVYSGALRALETVQEFTPGRYSTINHAASLFEYYVSSYLYREKEYPVNYPANAFVKIREDEDKLLNYLKTTMINSQYVYDFFDANTSSEKGDIWKLIALQYSTLCDEFYTVYTCARAYNCHTLTTEAFAHQLERLIKKRDKTIALCEDVRIEANQYTCIRDMTVIRQAIYDLLCFIRENPDKEVDIFNYDKYLSKESYFLR